VEEQCPAAGLILRGDHLATFGGKDADGCGVYLRKKFALNAAEQQADTPASRALGGSEGRDRVASANLWHQRFHGAQFFRKKIQDAEAAQ